MAPTRLFRGKPYLHRWLSADARDADGPGNNRNPFAAFSGAVCSVTIGLVGANAVFPGTTINPD
ncbi:MAG: hypothetical protein IH996_08780 [Proteobacteria bacterium]|nr:hypothetical protein [Pseudomonadota bacterium]